MTHSIRAPKADLLAIVETAYQNAASEHEWLENVMGSARVLDRGGGVFAQTYFVDPKTGDVVVTSIHGEGDAPRKFVDRQRQQAVFESAREKVGPAALKKTFPCHPLVGSFRELSGGLEPGADGTNALMDDEWEAGRTKSWDALGVLAGDPSGHGCLLAFPSGKRIAVPKHEANLLTRVAVHIAQAYRLVRDRTSAVDAPDAVLDPDGRVQHLETSRVTSTDGAALTAATRKMDRARGRLRRSAPDEALSIWRGLVEGRWSLVDHVDHDGRRYVFARRNAPAAHAWDKLTEREKQVVVYAAHGHAQALIAYSLGIGASAVREHLASAARKVRVASRAALLSAYRRDHGEASE